MFNKKHRNSGWLWLVVLAFNLLFSDTIFAQAAESAYMEGRPYRNLFSERGLATGGYIQSTLAANWNLAKYSADHQLIYDAANTNPPEAYVLDINNNDIRSEGMSYGMYVAVLLNDKDTFDKLWRFALNRTRQSQGWFAWQTSPTSPYSAIDTNPAPDGEEYFAMALFLAHGRWGSAPTGALNYIYYANDILDTLRTQLFDPQSQLIYFSPATSQKYTDPSYHLPLFYEMWALWASSNNDFWRSAAQKSREFLKNAAHPVTGLFPEYAEFNGQPVQPNTNGNANSGRFAYDSWRVIQNIALDYYWWSRDPGLKAIVERQQQFYQDKNFNYVNIYELNGTAVGSDRSPGHIWMNATSALISPIFGGYNGAPGENDIGWSLLQDVFDNRWNMPTGQYRYYDGMLQLLGLAHTSGQFTLYGPTVSASTSDLYPNLSNLVQPGLFIRNTTGQTLSNFTAKYFFTVENDKTPVLEDVWTPHSNLSLQQIQGDLWAVVMDYSGYSLAAGAQVPASNEGESFRLRYSDWSTFDKSNDYSQPESGAYNNSVRIAVYDNAGNLVMGSEPDASASAAPGIAKLGNAWSGKLLTATTQQNDAETRGQPANSGWSSQDWIVEPIAGTGHVRLKNAWTGKYLNVQNENENAKVVTYDLNPDWQSQQWIIVPVPGKATVRIRNLWSGKYITLVDTSDYSPIIAKALDTGWLSQEWNLQ